MKYEKIIEGKFVERPNRFVAFVEIGGTIEKVHVKNTGRCRELLIEGATVYLEDFHGRMGSRKLRYSLVAVRKKELLINMDSQAPNKAVKEGIEDGKIVLEGLAELVEIKSEKTYGNSRFDLFVKDKHGKEAFIEVKGVTLEFNGIAKFPDAPTERGVKHVEELITANKEGYLTYIVLLVQMEGMELFMPNYETHPEFGEALVKAEKLGTKVLCYGSKVRPDRITVAKRIPCKLES